MPAAFHSHSRNKQTEITQVRDTSSESCFLPFGWEWGTRMGLCVQVQYLWRPEEGTRPFGNMSEEHQPHWRSRGSGVAFTYLSNLPLPAEPFPWLLFFFFSVSLFCLGFFGLVGVDFFFENESPIAHVGLRLTLELLLGAILTSCLPTLCA